jgi:predicted metal-dependent hydrolase
MSTPRNLHFAIGRDVPRYWLGGRKSVTTFFDNLSVFFPVGERFFMHTVHAHQRHVKDEALLREVRAFCGQEGLHGREHERYNAWLLSHGLPVDRLERSVDRLLKGVKKRLPLRMQLAATCALEHFTAIMAQMLLGHPENLEGAHPTMAALWRWHAAEENEHRAVAYDVYMASGGHYAERVTVMLVASLIFWARVARHQVQLMKADGTASSPEEWRALLSYLFVTPGTLRRILPHYLAYYRPGFHPSDIDSSALLAEWERELGSSETYAQARAA